MTEIDEIGAEDLERWIGIAGRVRADRKGGVAEYVDWKRQAEDMVWLVASKSGEDAGAALAFVGWHSKPGTGHGEVFVLPEHRGTGVGSALYTRVAGWVQERGCVALETAVAEDDPESLAWVDRRGFREVGRNSKMVLDLTGIEAPEIDPPRDVEIVTWAERPELAAGLYAVACEAYPDVPGDEGTQMDPYDEWLSNDMQGDSDRPDATFIALVDGEVAGYAKLSLSKADTKVAYHDMTGVRREFRGRGIAAALKRTQIRWAKQAGYERLQTANEVRNAPIRALNKRHGYKLEPGLVILREALSGPD
jgi:GNAT superfamily N-acetyltransferase